MSPVDEFFGGGRFPPAAGRFSPMPKLPVYYLTFSQLVCF
jgi:hypothetical protein